MANKKAYLIHVTDNRYLLVKVLNEYQTEKEAEKSLVDLLTDKVTEKKLLKEYGKKESY